LDAACGTLGAGVTGEGQTQVQGGQAGGMSICVESCRTSPVLINGFHVIPDRWLVQGGTVGGGGILKWFKEQMAAGESFDGLTREASLTNPGSDGLVFLPYMAGERSPIWDKDAKGVFYGLDYTKTRGHIIRAMLEGVAFSLRHNMEAAGEAGVFARELRAMGGAANSDVWMQIKADVLEKPLLVPGSDTATTLGAAMLAGVAAGVYGGFNEAVSRTVKVKKTYAPNPETYDIYNKSYRLYRDLYERLHKI
jgi:xylulokinase